MIAFVEVDRDCHCVLAVGEGVGHWYVELCPGFVVEVVRFPFAFGLALGRGVGGGPRTFAFGLARALVFLVF